MRNRAHDQHAREDAANQPAMLRDPVCGMAPDPGSPHRLTHHGIEYRFCSAHCLHRFEQAPGRFVGGHEKHHDEPASAIAAATFTCPMHPDVRQKGPGSCPKCGMALEPLDTRIVLAHAEWVCPMHTDIVRDGPGTCPICGMALEKRVVDAKEAEENPELQDMSRRFWFATSLTVPLVVVAMGDLLPGQPVSQLFSTRARTLIELALATPVCLWSAWPFYVRAVRSVRSKSLNMFTLIGLGVSIAYVYSVIAALLPDIFPASFREDGEVAVYFEAAGVIVTLILRARIKGCVKERRRTFPLTANQRIAG